MNILKVATTASKALPVPVKILLMVILYLIKLILENDTPVGEAISIAASKFKLDEKIVSQVCHMFVK